MTVTRSTISNNTATGDGGGIGGIASGGANISSLRVRLSNLTISGNTAARGGGAFVQGFDDSRDRDISELTNSTITGNSATNQGGGVFFFENPEAKFESNVVAENTATNGAADVRFASTNDATVRNNFIGSNDGTDLAETGSTPDADGNFVGSPQALLDPELAPPSTVGLQQVRRPLADSPVINAGRNSVDLDSDQLGLPRSVDGGVDIGAVEVAPSTLVVSEASVTEGDTGTRNLVFDVELAETTGPFTVDVRTIAGTATAGVDYQSLTQVLSFNGTAGERKEVRVTVINDTDLELNETVLLRFEDISDTSVTLPDDAVGEILNDDTSGTYIDLVSSKLSIVATGDDDVIEVTANGDFYDIRVNDEQGSILNSRIGRFEIEGFSGDDLVTLTGTTEPTTLIGGAGDDTIQGGDGRDWIFGDSGADSLSGGDSRDIIEGGAGNDTIHGEAGDDVLRGGDGEDTIRGNDGFDLVYGGDGNDVLEGQDGPDRIRGGGGNDTLRGGEGEDSLAGGGGHDLVNGGGDSDIVSGNNGADRMNGDNGDDYMNAGKGHDTVTAGDGNDTLLGREGNDVLLGEGGDDFINGLTDRDIIYGGDGEDTLQGRAGEDILIGGTITPSNGTSVRDLLTGGIQDEWLSSRPYNTRVANILDRTGQSNNRLNTDFLIGTGRSGQNVFDDLSLIHI